MRRRRSGRPSTVSYTHLLRSEHRPTAIFAAGYYYALDVYAAAAEAGLSIPTDLSVIGVDDPASAAHLSPALTTLRQPLVDLGRMAANGLFDIVSGDVTLAQRTTLRAELVERGSVAPFDRNTPHVQTNQSLGHSREITNGSA